MFVHDLERMETLVDSLCIPPFQLNISPILIISAPERVNYKSTLHQTITELDSQYDVVARVAMKLDRIRTELYQRRAMVKNALAPVSALPPETLSRIFDLAVNSSVWSTDCARYISQTSSSWRVIAVELPFLWMNIAASPIKHDEHPRIIPFLLPRIRNQPFSLCISAHDLSAALLLNQEVRRSLHTLSIQLPDFLGCRCLNSIFDRITAPKTFPILRSLSIHSNPARSRKGSDTVSFYRFNDGKAPLLKHLYIHGLMPEYCNVPSLETVHIDWVDSPLLHLRHLFENCLGLRSITLKGLGTPQFEDQEEFPWLYTQCTLPKLETMVFQGVLAEVIDYVLTVTRAPNLRMLTIDNPDIDDWDGKVGFQNLLNKSPRIEVLRLKNMTGLYPHTILDNLKATTATSMQGDCCLASVGLSSLKFLAIYNDERSNFDAVLDHATAMRFFEKHQDSLALNPVCVTVYIDTVPGDALLTDWLASHFEMAFSDDWQSDHPWYYKG